MIEHDHEYCITDDGVAPGCPTNDPLPYPCPRSACEAEFATGYERVDHLVNDHDEAAA